MPKYANEVRFTQTWYSPAYPTTIEEVEANWPMFKQRADLIAARYPTISTIGVAGAGYGALMYYLYFTHGKNPWGFDIAWAANQGAGTLKAASNRLIAADALVPADMELFRRAATGSGDARNKIPLIVTEDMLPCVDNEAEVQAMLTNLRAISSQMIHIVTPSGPNQTTDDMLWRTPQEWRQIVGPTDALYLVDLTEVT